MPVFSLRVPGQLTAKLFFRVGTVDETLPWRGVTHMVEHLALHPLHERADWWRAGGSVEPYVTHFSIRGTAGEVCTFLGELTSHFSDLPTERLDGERNVLRTEAANKNYGSYKEIWSYRYGARGLGVSDYREFGLKWLGAPAAKHWSAERFNANNCALWLSGDIPGGLRLNLKPGRRFPVPFVEPLRRKTPAVYRLGNRGIALSMLGASGSTAYVVADILAERIRRRLRHQEAIAYHTGADLRHSGAPGMTGIVATADSVSRDAWRAATSVIEIVRDLDRYGHRTEDLDVMFASMRAARHEPSAAYESLEDAARCEIGAVKGVISWDEFDADAAALTPDDVADYVESALSTAMLVVPESTDGDFDGFTPLPGGNGRATQGSRILPTPDAGHSGAIDYSDDGVAWVTEKGSVYGIPWREVAAALWWKDGTRALIGEDGTEFEIVPKEWSDSGRLIDAIRVHVPEDRWVPMDGPDAKSVSRD